MRYSFLSPVHSILQYAKQVFRLIFSTHVHRTSLQYRYTQNQFKDQLTVHMYTKPVCRNSLQFKCTKFCPK